MKQQQSNKKIIAKFLYNAENKHRDMKAAAVIALLIIGAGTIVYIELTVLFTLYDKIFELRG